jgi:hypothetical protein
LASSAGGQAADEPVHDLADVAAPTISDSISEAELQDLSTIAEQNGISLKEAIDRYAWNDNFALAVDKVRQTVPEAFTSAEIVDADDATVAFAADVPDEAREIMAEFNGSHHGVSVEFQTDLGYTELALEEAIEDVHYAVYETSGVESAVTAFDEDSGEITATVILADDTVAPALADLRALAARSLATATRSEVAAELATDVVVSKLPALGGDDSASYHYGGESISGCTSGFGTRASSATSGTRGISTAGHCGNSQSDDGYSLTFKKGYRGTHGDFQWHTGPKTESDDFYSGNSSSTEVNRRDVSGLGFPSTGQSLCKNGKTNHKSCQEVRKLDVCSNDDCHLIQMGARLAAGGDSGGPIFWGNTAYGLHKGWQYDPVWPYDRDLFSRGSRIDNALGVWIATS